MTGGNPFWRRIGAMFCAVVTLAYAAAMCGGMIDGVAHELHTPHGHHHLSFADMAFADDFHETHDPSDAAESGEHLPGHQHHHSGDGPSSHPATFGYAHALREQSAGLAGPAHETAPSVAGQGFDHPPKSLTDRA